MALPLTRANKSLFYLYTPCYPNLKTLLTFSETDTIPPSMVASNPTVSSPTIAEAYLTEALAAGRLRQTDILSHLIGLQHLALPNAISSALKSPIFVGLDAEWFERAPHPITELGVSIFLHQPRMNEPVMAHPLADLHSMITHHVRIIENAHMTNGELCQGYPEHFQFGKTRFVTMAQARQALLEAFRCGPVIFIGHAVDNDIAFMKSHMGVDLAALGTIAVTLDTQVMARELGLSPPTRKISLKALLAQFRITEPYLHNAGNDIAQTIIAAWLLAYENSIPGSTYANPSNAIFMSVVKAQANVTWRNQDTGYGIETFCTRCDSKEHTRHECTEVIFCTKCAGHPRLGGGANTHRTDKCTAVRMVVVPCEACSVSTDPKRWKNATTHVGEECFFSGSESSGSDSAESV
jgi:hypothetical protein